MWDLNKVLLLGRISSNIELRKINEWTSVVNFNLVTNRVYKNKNGEKIEEAEFHRCVAFWPIADIISQYLSKWRKIYLEWRLRTRQWEDASGNKRYTTEIIVLDVSFCEPRQQVTTSTSDAAGVDNVPVDDEDLPF
jgi:single-strand DNA-binding protein